MRLLAYLQAFDLLRDELGRPPSTAEYACRFRVSAARAAGDRAVFDAAFPGQAPERVLDVLWGWRDARRDLSSETCQDPDAVPASGRVETRNGLPIPRG